MKALSNIKKTIKYIWQLSETDCIGILGTMGFVFNSIIYNNQIDMNFWLILYFMFVFNLRNKYSDMKVKKLEDRIEELENKQ